MIMKNKIIVIVLLMTLVSCADFLDISPFSQWKLDDCYSNKTEVEMALAGIYSQLANDNVYGFNFNVRLEAGTDETYTSDYSENWKNARYETSSSDDIIKNAWTSFYSCINLVNLFEENLNNDFLSDDEYNRYLAKARFYRAFCYMHLANWWGDVPLRLKPTVQQADNNVPSSPVLEIYEQVEKDFLFAVKHLAHASDPTYIPGEPNSMAARGLLARLYLKMGGYQPYLSENEAECYFPDNEQYFDKALAQCDTIIYVDNWHSITPFSEDNNSYRNHFLNYIQDRYDTKESLFEISFGYMTDKGISIHGRIGNINGVYYTGTTKIPRGFSNINPSVVLYDLYMEDTDDKRIDWNISGYINKYAAASNAFRMSYILHKPLNFEYSCGKYRRWEPKDLDAVKKSSSGILSAPYIILNEGPSATDPNFTSINFPVLRFSDVLLMYAEAAIGGRFGNTPPTQKALNCLNRVRNRAGLGNFSTTDHDTFFEEIVNERLRELCFEGLRKQDLIRWDLLESKLAFTALSIKNNASFDPNNTRHQAYLAPSINFNRAKHLTLPYPLQEIEINNKLSQKLNWK